MFRLQGPTLAIALLAACHDLPAPAPDAGGDCLFGAQFSDIREHQALIIESEVWLRSVAALGGELAQTQLVVAVQQSSHTDVATAAEALARVDQREVRRIELRQTTGAGRFTVYEYGVGDNSYGAFFAAGTAELVASIHDGDLLNCRVPALSGLQALARDAAQRPGDHLRIHASHALQEFAGAGESGHLRSEAGEKRARDAPVEQTGREALQLARAGALHPFVVDHTIRLTSPPALL
jgi:hypothetical protein